MSSSIGIYASQISGHLVTNNYSSIQTVTVGSGGASSITFSSIPSTWTHLQIRYIARTADNGSGGIDNILASFNGDTTYTNYRSHYLNGNGSATAAGSIQVSSFYTYVGDVANSYNSNTTIYGVAVVDILDYANTNKNKVVRSINGADRNGSGSVNLTSALWINTNAISAITLNASSGASISQYSTFALFGVK